MTHQFLSDFLRTPVDMAVTSFVSRLEPSPAPEVQFSSGKIVYRIRGKVWIYEVRIMYPEAWDTIPAKSFLGRKTSQCLFEQRGSGEDSMRNWNPGLLGFFTRPIWIWNILIALKLDHIEGGLVNEDLVNEMLEELTERFKQNVK